MFNCRVILVLDGNMLNCKLMTEKDEELYEELVRSRTDSLFYHSIKFRNLLKNFVGEDCYLLGFHGKELIAAIPAFMRKNDHGNVINSLPFWGSNGGIIVRPDLSVEEIKSVKLTLLENFFDLAEELNCILSTIIVSPLEEDPDFYTEFAKADFIDGRIGQITVLPESPDPDKLLAFFEPVRRRNIRKALKSGLTFYHSDGAEDMEFLRGLHSENISAIGGLTKPSDFFKSVRSILRCDDDYRIYIAEKSGDPIAGLLVFYYNYTVEYYIPAVSSAYRTLQPLSYLVFQAMVDAIREGYKYWNWGGTWHSQKGVYDFKKRWGTKDLPYNYYIKIHSDISRVKSFDKSRILKEYPYFYVMPFSKLEDNS
jgi:hypothetical protein